MSRTCVSGGREIFTPENLQTNFQSIELLENISYNIGYFWIDALMLYIGDPATTEADYAYYLSYYIGDIVFRFFFFQQNADTDNCWYPWSNCIDEITFDLIDEYEEIIGEEDVVFD